MRSTASKSVIVPRASRGVGRWAVCQWSAIAAATLGSMAHAQCGYEIVAVLDLPPCGVFQPVLEPRAINNNGEVVGSYRLCEIGEYRPFYWSEGTGLVLPTLPPGYLSAQFVDINDQGQITGNRVVAGSGSGNEAILYEDGVWTGLGTVPGGDWSEGLAINETGVIVGFAGNTVAGPGELACRWDKAVITELNSLLGGSQSKAFDIASNDVIVGCTSAGTLFSEKGFVLNGRVVTVIQPSPGLLNAEVRGINEAGTVVVNCQLPGKMNWNQGFLVNGDSWQHIPPIPPGEGVATTAINESGTVLGVNYAYDFAHVVTFADGKVRVVEDMILAEEPYQLYFSSALNDAGWIAAAAQIGQTFMTLVLRPAPQKLADLNEDCEVDVTDLALLIERWGQADDGADLDGDGIVASADLGMLLGEWGT
jgi:hypothetical protein